MDTLRQEPWRAAWRSYRHYAFAERGIVLVSEEQPTVTRVRRVGPFSSSNLRSAAAITNGGAPLLAFFEKWLPRPPTSWDSRSSCRRSCLHLQNLPAIDLYSATTWCAEQRLAAISS